MSSPVCSYVYSSGLCLIIISKKLVHGTYSVAKKTRKYESSHFEYMIYSIIEII